jgi:hypothetical protein
VKVSIACDSPLLRRSLELFLRGHICTYEESDLVVTDHERKAGHKAALRIGNEEDADLRKPFSKEALLSALEAKLGAAESSLLHKKLKKTRPTEADLSVLEAQIEQLTKEYQTNIIKAVRRFYEKK